jgi:hypothetical protein
MKISIVSKLSILFVVCAMSLTVSAANAEGKGNAQAKGKQQVETKGKHGREASELPFGLEQYSEKKGELPSGLQKKKDAEDHLTRGLEEGGKDVRSTVKGKKSSKL